MVDFVYSLFTLIVVGGSASPTMDEISRGFCLSLASIARAGFILLGSTFLNRLPHD